VNLPTAERGSRLHQAVQSIHLWIVVGTCGSVGMVLIGTSLGSVIRPGNPRWWFQIPEGPATVARLGFYASVAVLIIGWLGVGYHARQGRLTVTRSWVILALWGLPLLVGPPLFSRDIYSYIGQGLLAYHGFNPYSVAPSALGNARLLASIAEVWRNTASPYGPLFVAVSQGAAAVAGTSLVVQVLVFRVLELAGVAMVMVSLPTLSRRLGTDPGMALWLGALSPLALFSFVASGHNDALMMGLLVAGVTLATGGRLALGLTLCALAATIKLPAAAAILFIGVDQFRAATANGRWRVVLEAVVVPIVVVVGVTLAAGLGWTWLGPTALHVPTELRILSTPSVSLGTFFHSIVHAVGIPVSQSKMVTATQSLCELVVVVGVVWMLWNVHKLDVVRLLGLSLMLIVVGSPTLWPWYLMWGLTILAATRLQRSNVLAAVAGLAMLMVGPGGSPMFGGDWYFVIAPLALAGCAWLVWDRHWWTVVSGHVA
jgi:alpha-1,6-mannosyltransferase